MLPKTPSFRLDGLQALVVGASSGIGRACAVALADFGAKVTLCARRQPQLDALKTDLEANGRHAATKPLNITDTKAVTDFIQTHEPFDILINAAGIARHGPASETQVKDYDAVMEINTKAAFFLAREVARRLAEAQRPGSLITISSQMAHVGGPERAVYCASKHAIEGFTKAMAIEWGSYGIRFNTLCPTFIRTELTQKTFNDPEKRAWVEKKIKLGRVGELEDIMGAAVFLASSASSLITGTSLLIDGGWTAD